MRVLHVLDTLDQHPGLLSVTLPGLLSALRDLGIESDIAAGASHDDWMQHVAEAGEVVIVDEDDASGALYGITPLAQRADLVHIHAPHAEVGKIAVAAASGVGRRFVVSTYGSFVRDIDERGRVSLWLENRTFGKKYAAACHVACMNEHEVQAMRRRGIEANYVVLPVGYTAPDRAIESEPLQLPWTGEKRVIAYFGDIDGRCGLIELFEMCGERRAQLEGWALMLAGRPIDHWLDHFQRLAAADACGIDTDFVVYPDAGQQLALLEAADFVVVPNLTPSTGIAALWALNMRKAVLMANVTAIAGALTTMRDLITDATPEALRDGLVRFTARSREQLDQFASEACDAMRDKLNWSSCAAAYANLYQSSTG